MLNCTMPCTIYQGIISNAMELYPYQQYGATWLSKRKHALLADEMGVGKTPQAVGAIDILLKDPVLICCPTIATINWQREIENFSLYGWETNIVRTRKDQIADSGIVICPYSLVGHQRIHEQLVERNFRVGILDESHYLKSRKAQRTKAVFGKRLSRKNIQGVLDNAEHIYALSGTPMPNNPSELWVVLRAFGLFKKDQWSFTRKFCKGYDNGFSFKITGAKNVPALKKLLAPITLRRKLEDVMDEMPEVVIKNMVVKPCEVDEEVWFPKFYADRKKREIIIAQETDAANCVTDDADSTLNNLKDKSFPELRKYTGFQKIPTLAEIVAGKLLDPNRRVVVFAVHRDAINYSRQLLKAFKPRVIYGGTPQDKRQRSIDMFDAGTCRLLLCNIGAAGVAIRFKGVDEIIFLESSWVPADNEQAISRGLWQGREKPLFVTYLSIADSTDEVVNDAIVTKMKMINEVFQ